MSRSWQLFLRDMLEAAQKVSRYTGGRDLASFTGDENPPTQYRDLSDIAGTWVEDPEIDEALADQRRIDPKLWQ